MVPLFFPLVALITGILSSRFLDPQPVWICLPLAVLLACARRRYALLAIFLLGAGLRSLERPVPTIPVSEPVRVVGRLLRTPEWRGLGAYLDMQLMSIDEKPTRGRARLTEFLEDPELKTLFGGLDLGTGDRIEVIVALRRPAAYRDPGVFDFRRYLEREGIYWTGTIRNPRLITVLDRGWHGPDRIRDWIEDRLRRRFESDRVVLGLVMGMVLGQKQDLTAETERQFQEGGIYHLVVVSGFNLAVVAAAAAWIARFIAAQRRTRLLIVLTAVLAYATAVTLVGGGQIPVLRAALMAGVLIAARALDRGYSSLNSIALTAFILLLADPTALEDASFQMTFAAVIAVVGMGPPATQWVFQSLNAKLRRFSNAALDGNLPAKVADWRVARRMWCEVHGLPHAVVTIPWRLVQIVGEGLLMSVCVESVFTYFMVESFHRLSPISPIVNVPAGLIAAAITPLGLLLIVLPDILAGAPVWLIRELVHILLWILKAGLKFPNATLRVPSGPPLLWALYTLALAAVVFSVYRKKRGGCLAAGLAVAGLQGLIAFGDFSPRPPRDMVLTFLDVGQGDSILAEFPDGRRMLVDGGGVAAGRFLGLRDESSFSIGEDVVSAYLFSRRIRRLDVVVLTHAHNDHMDGLFDVIENFRVGELWVGRNPLIPAYRALLGVAAARQVPVRWVSAGQQPADNITVLHPPADWKVRKTAENNDSVVLLLTAGRQTALLTGDLELAIPVPTFVNVYKVPHHGSKGARLRVRSDVRVISVGANNPFGHPHPSTLPALRTDRLGAISVTLAGERPKVDIAPD